MTTAVAATFSGRHAPAAVLSYCVLLALFVNQGVIVCEQARQSLPPSSLQLPPGIQQPLDATTQHIPGGLYSHVAQTKEELQQQQQQQRLPQQTQQSFAVTTQQFPGGSYPLVVQTKEQLQQQQLQQQQQQQQHQRPQATPLTVTQQFSNGPLLGNTEAALASRPPNNAIASITDAVSQQQQSLQQQQPQQLPVTQQPSDGQLKPYGSNDPPNDVNTIWSSTGYSTGLQDSVSNPAVNGNGQTLSTVQPSYNAPLTRPSPQYIQQQHSALLTKPPQQYIQQQHSAPSNIPQYSAPSNIPQYSAPSNIPQYSAPSNIPQYSAPSNVPQYSAHPTPTGGTMPPSSLTNASPFGMSMFDPLPYVRKTTDAANGMVGYGTSMTSAVGGKMMNAASRFLDNGKMIVHTLFNAAEALPMALLDAKQKGLQTFGNMILTNGNNGRPPPPSNSVSDYPPRYGDGNNGNNGYNGNNGNSGRPPPDSVPDYTPQYGNGYNGVQKNQPAQVSTQYPGQNQYADGQNARYAVSSGVRETTSPLGGPNPFDPPQPILRYDFKAD